MKTVLHFRIKGIVQAFLFLSLLAFTFHSCVHAEFNLYDLATRRTFSLNKVIPSLSDIRMIFVGEVHDQMHHHLAQLRIIQSLHEKNLPVAIGMEMFRSDSQDALSAWIDGSLSEEDFIKVYYENWDMPWAYYRPILLYAKEHTIPIIGLNIDPGIVRQVAKKGFSSLNKEQLEKLPGVSCNVNENYRKFIRRALGAHGTGNEFQFFCEAQMVWDSTMARNLVNFSEQSPGHTIVVLAGGGHAWKPGIPSQVLNYGRIPLKVILPELSAAGNKNISLHETDYLILGI